MVTALPAKITFTRCVAYTAFLLTALLFSAYTVPQPASAGAVATPKPKAPKVSDEIDLSITGLKPKLTYLINIVASKDSIFDCGGGGTYENGQLSTYTRSKSTGKGEISTKLTPARALGVNWCESTYKGTVKHAGSKSTVASFSFKAKG